MPMVDDVARMNAQQVERVFSVRTLEDVKEALALARQHGKPVSMRGTRHSMGGHTIAANGYVLDLMLLNRWSFDTSTETVTTEPGAMWSDLIAGLNEFGYSPRTMQSYSTFSVGGSLAVNAHGITTDYCMAEAVVRFKLIRWDGSEVVCSREAEGEARELFGLALGGYGMFGVIGEVTLKVVPNVKLSMEMLQLPVADFPDVYAAALEDEDGDIDTKMARLDVTTLESVDLFLFRRDQQPGTRTISTLAAEPHCMPIKQQVLYKWILPQLKEARYALERAVGQAIDIEASSERNVLMYESAVPLARLYSPLFEMDDTFVLQEYFVPKGAFSEWIDAAKPAYALAAQLDQIELLNTTIRFVHADSDTVLAYARAEQGSYAFVIYYRVHRNAAADGQLEQVHQLLAQAAVGLGGTFYLPYRHHYSDEELGAAYPAAEHFFRRKQAFDPHALFRSSWYERYGRRFWIMNLEDDASITPLPALPPQPPSTAVSGKLQLEKEGPPWVSERRRDSYRRLLREPKLRAQFRDQFLVRIFNIEDPRQLYNSMARVARDPRNAEDVQCFTALQALLSDQTGAMTAAGRAWKQVRQLRLQKNELLRETGSLLSQLGRLGTLVGYASIGDHGKMVLEYQRHLHLQGKVWVVHDVNADAGRRTPSSSLPAEADAGAAPPSSPSTPESPTVRSRIPSHNGSTEIATPELSAVLERGCVDAVGEHVPIDYQQIEPLAAIPNSSCDLVTMHQGLHHLPQAKLAPFLREVHRILRPSGLFLVREHDARPDLIPMLDMAHSIFNAVTGVSAADEASEIRAFRPILEWRAIIEAAGFVDCMVYEVEKGDPTIDEMMCFIKPTLSMLLDSGPPALLDFLRVSQRTLSQALPQLEEFILSRLEVPRVPSSKYFENAPPIADGLDNAMLTPARVKALFEPIKLVVERFGPVLEHVQPLHGLASLLPLEEAFLLVKTLLLKAESGESTATEKAAIEAIQFVQAAFGVGGGGGSKDVADGAKDEAASAHLGGAGEPRRVALDASATAEHSARAADNTAAIEALLRRLLIARPELGEPRTLEGAGFPPRAVSLLFSQLDGVGVVAVSRMLSQKLDSRAFDEFSAAMERIIMDKDLPPLSYDRPGGLQDVDSPWRGVAMAVLGAPRVRFSSSAQTMASLVGLAPLMEMWRQAQRRQPTPSHPDAPAGSSSEASPSRMAQSAAIRTHLSRSQVEIPMSAALAAQIGAAYEGLDMQRYEVSVELDDGLRREPILGVKAIQHATFREVRTLEGRSEVLSEIDCTAEAGRRLLEEQVAAEGGVDDPGGVDGEKAAIPGASGGGSYKLHLCGERVDKLLRKLDVVPRHPSAPQRKYQFGDLTRRAWRSVDGMLEQAFEGVFEGGIRRVLDVRFSRCPEQVPEAAPVEYLPRVTALVKHLDAHGLLRELHRDDGEYTWYKLNEWMQVEIMEAFGASLSHAAWYRFPLMEMLSMYFTTFAKTATIVQNKFGFQKAWLSAAAMYDIVPGFIMAFYFSQLWLLGMPLRAVWGSGSSSDDYAKEYTGDKAPIEELLVRTGLRPPEWSRLDAQIQAVRRLLPELYVLTVPTFKPLTEALLKLSTLPELEVLRISNQEQVQVRVQFRHAAQLDALRGKHGVQVMFEYTFPVDGSGRPPPTTASLCVEVPYLLSTIRFCRQQQVDVMQVYDFWK